nr:hypothetical protein [Tanacetum cinerariifolium]
MELDEHAPVYVPEPQHPEYYAPSDDDIQVEDDDNDPEEDPKEDPSESHEPEDDDEDPEEDPNEEHEPEDDDEDPEEDPNEEHEPEDEDTKEPSKGIDETESFEEDKIAVTPPPSRHRGARISVRPETPMAASTQALIDAFAPGSSPFPLPATSPAYDQAQLGHRATMIHRRDDIFEEDMPPWRRFTLTSFPPGCDVAESLAVAAARAPRSQYNFVDTVEAGHGLIRSPGHDTWTIARAADKAEDSVEDLAVTQMMRIHTLEARTRTDTVEDANSSCAAGHHHHHRRKNFPTSVSGEPQKDFSYPDLYDPPTSRRTPHPCCHHHHSRPPPPTCNTTTTTQPPHHHIVTLAATTTTAATIPRQPPNHLLATPTAAAAVTAAYQHHLHRHSRLPPPLYFFRTYEFGCPKKVFVSGFYSPKKGVWFCVQLPKRAFRYAFNADAWAFGIAVNAAIR